MKKTFIALMVLASCAMGETTAVTLANATAVLDSSTTSYTFVTNAQPESAYMVFSLSDSILETFVADTTINKTFASFAISGSNTSTYVGLSDTTYSNSNGTRLRINNSEPGTFDGRYWSSTIDRSDYTTQLSEAKAVTLCLGSNKSGGYTIIMSMVDAAGEVTHLATASATSDSYSLITEASIDSNLVDSAYVFSGSYTEAGLKSLSAALLNSIVPPASVPEPTTATLSLLALAGLCARRRRH